jgi:hypothetical protein
MATDEGKLDHQQAITRGFESATDSFKTKSPNQAVLIDEVDSSTTYVGKAAIGSAASSPSWQIIKLAVSGTVTTLSWADGDENFDNIWSLRASLSYS